MDSDLTRQTFQAEEAARNHLEAEGGIADCQPEKAELAYASWLIKPFAIGVASASLGILLVTVSEMLELRGLQFVSAILLAAGACLAVFALYEGRRELDRSL